MAQNNNKQRKPVKNPDPMSNPVTMGREGLRIIRNIAHGKYNIYAEGHIFRNMDLVNATINEIDKYLLDIGIHIAAINYAYAGTTDANVLRLLHKDKKSYEAYSIARQAMQSIAMTGDTGFLWVLASKLPNYKYNM